MKPISCASVPRSSAAHSWHSIDWKAAYEKVEALQRRIFVAARAGRWGKVQALQHLLRSSFYGKCLAVRRVTENRGKKTAGIDGQLWDSPRAKWEAIQSLARRGYRARALRRVYIPKGKGKRRPLGIPTMKDRAMQALHALALSPVAEATADRNSYGFRPGRNCADALEQCHIVWGQKNRAQWALEADIAGCFDHISHSWLLTHIPTDKRTLKQWLKAGHFEKGQWHGHQAGTPQGGIISPILANMALDGLEQTLEQYFHINPKRRINPQRINLVRYADDFVISGVSEEVLRDEVWPLLKEFLQKRGLQLSPTKTRIAHVDQGFTFLGQTFRRLGEKYWFKPSKESVKRLKQKIRQCFHQHRSSPTLKLIQALNPILRGWANYHRHAVSSKIFDSIGHYVFWKIWRWAKRRHPQKGRKWIINRYFPQVNGNRGTDKWILKTTDENGKVHRCFQIDKVPIVRHIKVRHAARFFDPEFQIYFDQRKQKDIRQHLRDRPRLRKAWYAQSGKCPVCQRPIEANQPWQVHHRQPKSKGGKHEATNLALMHPDCHRQWHVKERTSSQKAEILSPREA
jgi:RNA-directed DNA polymerase